MGQQGGPNPRFSLYPSAFRAQTPRPAQHTEGAPRSVVRYAAPRTLPF